MPLKEIKIFLAKNAFMYYLDNKEFEIVSRICRTLLIFILLSVAYHSNVFADIKEKSREEYRLKGYEAQQKGKLEEALSLYAKAVSLSEESESVSILNDMGVIYEEMGLSNKAEESYLEALGLNDHYLPAISNLAYLYKKRGDTEKAVEYFKKRIEWGEPGDIWIKKAKKELSDLSRDSPKIRRWLTQRETMELTDELVRKERQDFYERVTRADNFYKNGQELAKARKYEQAIEEYHRALSLTPKNPKIIAARDEARLKLIQEKVKESSDAALKMLELGDVVSAKIEFRKILTIIPNEPIQIAK